MTYSDEHVLDPVPGIDEPEPDINPETDIGEPNEDPNMERPSHDEPVEDPETEDDIIHGVDDDPDDGLPPEDESRTR